LHGEELVVTPRVYLDNCRERKAQYYHHNNSSLYTQDCLLFEMDIV
jgi:hypothetical protein